MGNTDIRVGNKPVVYTRWVRAGIVKIEDLLDEDNFMTLDQVTRRYGVKIPFTEFEGLIKAIPEIWKEIIGKDQQGENYYDWFKVFQAGVVKRFLYKEFNKDTALMQGVIEKWSKDDRFGLLEYHEYLKAFNNIKRITNYVKFLSFQYKLLCHAIVTNVQTFYYGLTTKWCSLCGIEKETIAHLFFDCFITQGFYKEVCEWLDIPLGYLTITDVLLNCVKPNPKHVENLIILAAKYYIYLYRCKKDKLTFRFFKSYILSIKDIEKNIALGNQKMFTHELKWSLIK